MVEVSKDMDEEESISSSDLVVLSIEDIEFVVVVDEEISEELENKFSEVVEKSGVVVDESKMVEAKSSGVVGKSSSIGVVSSSNEISSRLLILLKITKPMTAISINKTPIAM